MADRAIIPLLPALALGFLAGIIVSALQVGGTATIIVCVAGAVLTAAVGASSVLGVRADPDERKIVAGLRVALAIGLFLSIYLFILGFLRDGSLAALLWVPFALAFGVMLGRLQVRDREEVQRTAS